MSITLSRLLKDLVGVFNRTKVPYALTGAMVVGIWGRARGTRDIDFMIMVSPAKQKTLFEKLEKIGFRMNSKWADHNPMIRGVQFRIEKSGFPVDFLMPRDFHDRQAIKNRKRKKVLGISAYVLSPEDCILSKLKVGRPYDVEDALSVFVWQRGRLDYRYLNRWAKRLKIYPDFSWVLKKAHEQLGSRFEI